jgi:hypothetical protein
MNIPRYVDTVSETELPFVETALQNLREGAERAFTAETKFIDTLKREGLIS